MEGNQQDVEPNHYGFDPVVRQVLVDMLKDHPRLTPSTMGKNLLIESRKENSTISGLTLPSLKQIQRLKTNLQINSDIVERDKVASMINDRSFKPGIKEDIGFIFNARNGTGENDDPFTVPITSLAWLSWLRE